jgi:hypothetical protein
VPGTPEHGFGLDSLSTTWFLMISVWLTVFAPLANAAVAIITAARTIATALPANQ